jgi:hypothetical protein
VGPGDNVYLKENRTAPILRALFLEEHVQIVSTIFFNLTLASLGP